MQICISSSIVNTLCRMQFLLVFVALYVGAVHSWDIATTPGDDTIFFHTNEALTMTVRIPFRNISALTYNENHNMMLYIDKKTNGDSICGYDFTNDEHKCFTHGSGRHIYDLAFDPVTERVFFTDTTSRSVNWISLKRGSKYHVYSLLKIDAGIPRDIVVDSCDGYIYWLNTNLKTPTIERAQLNGNNREVFEYISIFVNATLKLEPNSLAIDPPSRWLYWLGSSMMLGGDRYYLNTSSLKTNPEPRRNTTRIEAHTVINPSANSLTVSKNFIFRLRPIAGSVVTYKKNKFAHLWTKYYPLNKKVISIVAKYEITDQINGCEALSRAEIDKKCDRPYCVHGTKIKNKPACKCAPEYTGDRCDVSLCINYCLHGTCSFNVKGLPKCRCDHGYSGDRCSMSVCDEFCFHGNCSVNEYGLPACSCEAGYIDDRCIYSACEKFCMRGICSVTEKGLPECRCDHGYTGERCDIQACENFCFNGDCSINEKGVPKCSCDDEYRGDRCSIPVCENICFRGKCTVDEYGLPVCSCAKGYSGERCSSWVCENFCIRGNCNVNETGHPVCSCDVGYSGDRCSIWICEKFCLRGNCSVNEEGLPKCRCGPGYSGVKCHISVCENYCLNGDCCVEEDGSPMCSCNNGFIGKRCEIDACEGYCMNNGRCSLAVDNNPSCECATGYQGERCETADVTVKNGTVSILVN